MKIIYDTDQPREKRLCFIAKDGAEPCYGFRCFEIKLYDGTEEAKISNWKKTQKERNAMFKQEGSENV